MATGSYVVVTGASSGIGLETARAFAKRGRNVVIAARRKDRLEALRDQIKAESPDVDVVLSEVDLSSDEGAIAFYESLSQYDVDTWVNNAGRGDHGSMAEPHLSSTLQMLHTNVNGLAILSALFVGDHKDTPGAQLINVSSIGGYALVSGAVMYCATKHFVSVLTEGIDLEMKQLGHPLRAKVLAPGGTATEFEQVANDLDEAVDHSNRPVHTAEQMAGFLLDLYDGDKTVGEMDFETRGLKLSDPKFTSWGF